MTCSEQLHKAGAGTTTQVGRWSFLGPYWLPYIETHVYPKQCPCGVRIPPGLRETFIFLMREGVIVPSCYYCMASSLCKCKNHFPGILYLKNKKTIKLNLVKTYTQKPWLCFYLSVYQCQTEFCSNSIIINWFP